jgi:hypothetical protein
MYLVEDVHIWNATDLCECAYTSSECRRWSGPITTKWIHDSSQDRGETQNKEATSP